MRLPTSLLILSISTLNTAQLQTTPQWRYCCPMESTERLWRITSPCCRVKHWSTYLQSCEIDTIYDAANLIECCLDAANGRKLRLCPTT